MAKKKNGDGGKPKAVAEEIEDLWAAIEALRIDMQNVKNAVGVLRKRVIVLETEPSDDEDER